MNMTTQAIIKLPDGFSEYANESTRPLHVCSGHVRVWLEYWWGGCNGKTYLDTLVSTGQLTVAESPFRRKRMFVTEEVLRWALQNGAGA